MKYVDEFRNSAIAKKLIKKINGLAKDLNEPLAFMEVCGTHTVAMFRYGIRKILPKNIRIVSGPGCPVCVTAQEDIDKAIAISEFEDTIITTFGDMIKVPGTVSSLGLMRAEGNDIRIVYSTLDALDIARKNRQKKVVHLAIGFETTAPTIAAALKRAKDENLDNFLVLCSHKLIPPALEVLASSPKCKINGFILPGHVSTIIGAQPYEFIARKYKKACVISGFEAMDILQSFVMLLEQARKKKPKVEIQYSRCVKSKGNVTALNLLDQVFKPCDVNWRGVGVIRKSGLKLSRKYAKFDAEKQYSFSLPKQKKTPCRCGEVLQGIISPPECPLFKKTCTPRMPVGPCMVSSEGTCAAYYRYGGKGE